MTGGDLAAMARALALAERGRYTVRPNPLVGCVLIGPSGVVGEGWHERAGSPHAEVAALAAAGGAARGATAYVTLEPCAQHGRTGPCTDALANAGVARVVYAIDDPNPRAAGGRDALVRRGIAVERGVLAPWASVQNEVFLHVQRERRPFVVLKLAQTHAGGLVAPAGGRWITGERARVEVHRRRALCDAVLVGVGTVLADDPDLTVRHVDAPAGQPRAVVLDTAGRLPATARVVRPGTVVLTGETPPQSWRADLEGAGAEVVPVGVNASGRVSLPAALAALLDRGVQAILAECGATVAAALVDARLVDRLVLHVAPDSGEAGVRPRPTAAVHREQGWKLEGMGSLGQDLELVAAPVEQRRPRPRGRVEQRRRRPRGRAA